MTRTKKLPTRVLFLISGTFLLCWLVMQAAHECGHVLTAWAVGAHVERVVLNPLTFSRTDCDFSPHRAVIVWGGALGGCLIPALLWGIAVALRFPHAFLLRFLTGFCLIANGAYFGGDFSVAGPTDASELIALGTSRYALVAFGLTSVLAGLYVWNGQSGNFGFGPDARPIPRRLPVVVWAIFCVMAATELVMCPL